VGSPWSRAQAEISEKIALALKVTLDP